MRTAIRVMLGVVVVLAVLVGSMPHSSRASSHREAPLISTDPNADNTDVYAFVSPDRPDTVTIVANYIPLEEPAGGPNFNSFGDDVRYMIKIDNTGDGKEDISYSFRFRTKLRNPNTFLYNTGPITSLNDPDWNMPQTYTVRRITGSTEADSQTEDPDMWLERMGRARRLGDGLPTPPVNIGPRSTPNYRALAASAVRELHGGIKVFAGQRDDPFFVDLGSVFDLLGLRPFNPAHVIPLPAARGVDGVGGYNTHAIVIQVPINQLTRNGKMPTGPNDPNAVIGIYASAERQRTRVLRSNGTLGSEGPFVQVSRLANPLINEVVIPLGKKDLWNATDPADDAQFAQRYTNPEVTRLANALYPALDNANETNRNDLVAILLTGVPGLNFTGNTKADLLRLNMAIPPTQNPNRLGVLAGDLAGFPNGRRLADDVVDIELRALMEGYGPFLNNLLGLPNRSPNNTLGDGVDFNDRPFLRAFPYVGTPHQGYEHVHHRTPQQQLQAE
jgi:hypothetical protein